MKKIGILKREGKDNTEMWVMPSREQLVSLINIEKSSGKEYEHLNYFQKIL